MRTIIKTLMLITVLALAYCVELEGDLRFLEEEKRNLEQRNKGSCFFPCTDDLDCCPNGEEYANTPLRCLTYIADYGMIGWNPVKACLPANHDNMEICNTPRFRSSGYYYFQLNTVNMVESCNLI